MDGSETRRGRDIEAARANGIHCDEGHLGGYIRASFRSTPSGLRVEHGDPLTWSPTLWRWAHETLGVRSVLDVGCGEGHTARFFRDLGCDVLGVDGSVEARKHSCVPEQHVIHDFVEGPFVPERKFDLVWSSEFVEHVEESYVANFLAAFAQSRKYVMITYAGPGQRGWHHVNCQRASYWVRKLARIGFEFDPELTEASRDVAGSGHYKDRGLLFVRSEHCSESTAEEDPESPRWTLVSALVDGGEDQLDPPIRPRFGDRVTAFQRLLEMPLPMRLHVDPAIVADVRRRRGGFPTEIVPVGRADLAMLDHYDRCERIRRSPSWREQTDRHGASSQAALEGYAALRLQAPLWLRDLARENPFGTEGFAWVDGGIHLGSAVAPRMLAALDDPSFGDGRLGAFVFGEHDGMEVQGFPRHALTRLCGEDFVSRILDGRLLAGDSFGVDRFTRAYARILEQTLDDGLLGTEEPLLTVVARERPELVDARARPRLTRRERSRRSLDRRVAREFSRVLDRGRKWLRGPRKGPRFPDAGGVALGEDSLELHSVVCASDVPMSLWSIQSFVAYSGMRPRVVIHDDGSLTERHEALYERFLPGAEIRRASGADAELDEALAAWPTCRRFRARRDFFCARKLFDILFAARRDHVLLVDSDVLFFRRPDRLLENIEAGRSCFSSDYQDAYAARRDAIEAWHGGTVRSCVNAGLLHVPVEAYRERLDLVERYLAYGEHAWGDEPVNRHEQTVHALLMSDLGAERLPVTYRLAGPVDGSTVSFHFVDNGKVREQFWTDGLPRIRSELRAALR